MRIPAWKKTAAAWAAVRFMVSLPAVTSLQQQRGGGLFSRRNTSGKLLRFLVFSLFFNERGKYLSNFKVGTFYIPINNTEIPHGTVLCMFPK